MVSTPYDHIAGQFATLRSALFPLEAEYLSLLLDPLVPGSTILDLGCGTGYPMASFIADRGHQVVGVDGSSAMLALARARLPSHRWVHDLMQQVEFEPGTFAAVVCWDSLFHLPRAHYGPIIRRIHHWLVPGGRFMISSGGQVDDSQEGFTDTMFGHDFYYDSPPPGELVALVESIGFDILRAELCDAPDGDRNKGKWATVAEKQRP